MLAGVLAILFAVAALVLGAALLRQRRRVRAALRSAGVAPGRAGDVDYAVGAALTAAGDATQRAVEAAEQLERALAGAEFGVMLVDDAKRVVFANAAAEAFIGARHGEAVAEVRLGELFDAVLVSRKLQQADIDLYTPIRRVLRLRAVPLGNGVPGVVAYIEDLTQRRQIDAMRRDFVTNVSHELKTPLGALSVLAETLADAEDPTVRRRLAARLSGEAGRMSRLIEDIIGLGELEAGATPPEPVSVDEVIAESVARHALQAKEAGIEVEVAGLGSGAVVAADRRQLTSALSNLIDNAVKYTAVAGRPDPSVRVEAVVDGSWLVISVEDSGIGISEQHRDRVFERFYRVDRARSRATGGTGLGLAIVRHVAVNLHGSVEVESEEGVGSTFRLRIPILEEEVAS